MGALSGLSGLSGLGGVAGVSNSAPTDISISASTIAENAGTNATVGTLSTTDPNAGNTFTYTLVSGTGSTDNALFNISGATLRASASLDYEASATRSVRIRSTDQGGLYCEEAFAITVTNVASSVQILTFGNVETVQKVQAYKYKATAVVDGGSPETTADFLYFDDLSVFYTAAQMATALDAALEALSNIGAGKVAVVGSGSGNDRVLTCTFDDTLVNAVLTLHASSVLQPAITLPETVTQQGVNGVAEVFTISGNASTGISTFDFNGGTFDVEFVAGLYVNHTGGPTGCTKTAGGELTDSFITFTKNATGTIADAFKTVGDAAVTTDTQGAGVKEIHAITPTPVLPASGAWKPCSTFGSIGYDSSEATIQSTISTGFGSGAPTVTGTLNAGAVVVESNGFESLGDNDLAPVNVSLTAPEITLVIS